MTKQRMTLHRGLSELKLIDSRITKQIIDINPLGIFQKDRLINQTTPKEDFEKLAQSKYDSVIDLIDRKNKIKSAIVVANSETKMFVGSKEMTISDAITLKSTIQFKKQLIQSLKDKRNKVLSVFNKSNEQVQVNIQSILQATFGKENVKVSATDMDSVRKPYLNANEFHLFDPLKLESTIENLEKEIEEFESEVDASLSEINSTTFIEI